MRTTKRSTLTWTLASLALVTLLGAGIVSATGGGPWGARAQGANLSQCSDDMTVGDCRALMGDPCTDSMTVGDCRAAWDAKRADLDSQRQAQCVADHPDDANATQHCAQRPFGPGGPGGPHGRDGRRFHGNETQPE